ncbi:MAG: hypothetical protein RLZZ127_3250, partial [Planctomycetota bacterium]
RLDASLAGYRPVAAQGLTRLGIES